MFWRGYSSTRILAHVLQRVYSSVYEYLPMFLRGYRPWTNTCPMFSRVFVHGRILASCFWEGTRPTDEYLPHVFERVFVHRRICLTNLARSQRIRIPIRIRVRAGWHYSCVLFSPCHNNHELEQSPTVANRWCFRASPGHTSPQRAKKG